MFPIKDENKPRSFPIVNWILITLNVIFFAFQFVATDQNSIFYTFGFVPNNFEFSRVDGYVSIFTSMFVHGGLIHLFFNVWFLRIFGDDVEDELGHVSYFIFYILAGIVALLAQIVLDLASTIPIIGASGAISGVIGAYFVFFKHTKIVAVTLTLFGLWRLIRLPAWFFLGYWLAIQTISAVSTIPNIHQNVGGTAFFAHLGGFIFGYVIAFFIKNLADYFRIINRDA